MGWLMAAVYDYQMREVERACLQQWRGQLLQQAEGDVLELGAGTGANLALYPSDVTQLVLTEPDPHMRRKLHARVASEGRAASVRGCGAERIDAADASFDTVVCTLVLCSVAEPLAVLREARRVMRPGGQLLFLEHVAAPAGSKRLRWQRRLEPLWKRIAGNCHLTRDALGAIEQAGFAVADAEHESMRKALPIVRPTVRGVARRA